MLMSPDNAQRLTLFSHGWEFRDPDGEWVPVTLPHNAVDLPYDYVDERAFQRDFEYSKVFDHIPGPDVATSLVFEGSMADTKVVLNGASIGAHRDGYTPFEVSLTAHLRPGQNELTVKLSGVENPGIPPFGGRIDYLTYAGIYRDVWLKRVPHLSIEKVKVETHDTLGQDPTVTAAVWLRGEGSGNLTARLLDPDGNEIAQETATTEIPKLTLNTFGPAQLWTLEKPALYSLELTLTSDAGRDTVTETFGFRTAEFTARGFFLNGERVKLRGLNRHQSFPYIGYALGPAAQEQDAKTLKQDLGLNLVRTSHYPQSKAFLNACDRLGLLVFEEIPGWQHIGDADWKEASLENLRAMVERDWNHPSIILWGTRINESADNDAFYERTNTLCRALDSTRQTGGVRCISESTMLEDVYTMNDFILGAEALPGANHPRMPIRNQRAVTGLKQDVPYLITEYGGHMYPTQADEGEERQIAHVKTHLEVLNATYGDDSISGCIGWCFADYNTHKDFGAGDGICHHGVLDMFRAPKLAAAVYASQMDATNKAVLEPVTHWALGGRSIGGCLPLMILTNLDGIDVRFGDLVASGLKPSVETYPHLPHPPIIVDYADFGLGRQDVWGLPWADLEVTGFLGTDAVMRCRLPARKEPTKLELKPDRGELTADGRDCTRVIARATDQHGNTLPFLKSHISIALTGPVTLIGPERVTFRGGYAGFWIRSQREGGIAKLRVECDRFQPEEATIEIQAAREAEQCQI